MGIRIRKDRKTIVCAAKSEPQEGDYYIDDTLLHILHQEIKVLKPIGVDENGADLWGFKFNHK